MSGNRPQQNKSDAENPFQVALRAAVAVCLTARKCSQSDKALILALAARLHASEKDEILASLGDLLTKPTNRGGETFESVVDLLDHMNKSEWTTAELRRGLEHRGTPVTPRELSNVTNYLVKAGRFRRLARGHYVDGAGQLFVTASELYQTDISRGGENED